MVFVLWSGLIFSNCRIIQIGVWQLPKVWCFFILTYLWINRGSKFQRESRKRECRTFLISIEHFIFTHATTRLIISEYKCPAQSNLFFLWYKTENVSSSRKTEINIDVPAFGTCWELQSTELWTLVPCWCSSLLHLFCSATPPVRRMLKMESDLHRCVGRNAAAFRNCPFFLFFFPQTSDMTENRL